MAYVNVAEWKTNLVCEWLKGLDSSVLPYVHSFMINNVNGQQLLNLRTEDLEHLGVFKIGHQELILEAVEYLRNFHYELDRENLQLLAMRLSCQAHSLYNELSRQTDAKPVTTQTLSDVVAIITAVKPLVRWLDRSPFTDAQLDYNYNEKKAELLKLSLEMATCAQRDRFAEKPIEEIRTTCGQMAKLADFIIQDVSDPMILQPSSLDLATLKKKAGDDLGFCILPSFHGAHQIAEIKLNSPAYQCGKMEAGDEIVQVNYQTVVGWERKNVLELFRESPAEILLTLKKRPKHTKVYGQIYIKPYRLPSNKKAPYAARWQNNLPSPRPELLTIPDFTLPLQRHTPKVAKPEPVSILNTVSMLDTIAIDDSGSDSEGSEEEATPASVRLYSAKPRNLVQRRATITGASPTAKHHVDIEQLWRDLKREHSTSFQLRDKAVSCAQGLDSVPSMTSAHQFRPQTCLGIEHRTISNKSISSVPEISKKVQFEDGEQRHAIQLSLKRHEYMDRVENNAAPQHISDRPKLSREKNKESDKNVPSEEKRKQQGARCSNKNDCIEPHAPCILRSSSKERGRLDKSHSTPAYDLTESDDDFLERKFEAALDEHHKQQLQHRSRAASSASSYRSSSNKTDSRAFDSTEDLEDLGKTSPPKLIKSENQDIVDDCPRLLGNVAQKIINIEKNLQNIHNKSNENIAKKSPPKTHVTSEIPKTTIHIKINDVDVADDADDFEADSGNITTDIESDRESQSYNQNKKIKKRAKSKSTQEDVSSIHYLESSRESSEDKSESTSSYVEGNTTSCSSDGDSTLKKLANAKEIIDTNISKQSIIESTENENKSNENRNENYLEKTQTEHKNLASPNQSVNMNESILTNVQLPKISLNENTKNKYSHSPAPISSVPPARPETPKRETIPRPEIKPRLTPPEPPPRKFINNKPAPLNFVINQPIQPSMSPREHHLQTHAIEKPKVPDRPSVRRDLKKPDVPPEVHPREEKTFFETKQRQTDRIETYSDFVERSRDFIDEPSTPQSTTSLIDTYGYTHIPELSPKEDTLSHSSFGYNSSTIELQHNQHLTHHHKRERSSPAVDQQLHQQQHLPYQHKRELSSPTIDAADGACHSRQSSSSTTDSKPRNLEKERGVVNRAMMVARSMGLHGSSNKSSNSPKVTRKKSSLLAKRRNVGVKDVIPGDLEGWLTYRCRGAGGAWAKAWVILKGASLYRFKTQNSTKADCLIALSGFTAAQATEIKSRKFAFKVYYAGTVFYFAADTEDTLATWLDAIYRATIKAERTSGLFSETDESDSENKSDNKNKNKSSSESKALCEKTFGSLKKFGRKDSSNKDHEAGGASLDRKYLKFLGAKNQNVPVPTAQFRSYRRVLPNSSNPSSKPLEKHSSPDLQVSIAGSTFYGLNASQSATDVLASTQDMGDYRRTTERTRNNRNHRPEELQGFITLESFMLSRQVEECQRQANSANASNSNSPRFTPLNNDHVHFQHTNVSDGANIMQNNGMIYGSPRNEETVLPHAAKSPPPNPSRVEIQSSNRSFDSEANSSSSRNESTKPKNVNNSWESSNVQKKNVVPSNNHDAQQTRVPINHREQTIPHQQQSSIVNDNEIGFSTLDYGERLKPQPNWQRSTESTNTNMDFQLPSRRMWSEVGPHSGSSGDLACHTCTETMQRAKKEASVVRNGSFNLADRRRRDYVHPESNWVDPLRTDKRGFKYIPPAITIPPFDQEGMRATMDLNNEKNMEHKKSTKSLRNLFTKSPQKQNSNEIPKEQQKTLLGSPRLHRAIFGDRGSNQRQNSRSGSRSPADSMYNQSLNSYGSSSPCHNYNANVNSTNATGEWVSNAQTNYNPKYMVGGVSLCKKRPNTRHHMSPPTLPYIPPPTSPPPDYPGLECPPVFEPGTYSLATASLIRHKGSKNNQNYPD